MIVAQPDIARGAPGCAAVAAGSTAAANAAAAILRSGGNAVDAALGATLAAGVAEPVFTSLGGGGFLMVRQPSGESALLDFFAQVPGLGRADAANEPEFTPITVRFSGTDQVFHAGAGSVAVPGVLAGVLESWRQYGRTSLSTVVAPAIACGRNGTLLEPVHAAVLQLVREIMSSTPACRDLIIVGDRYAVAGDVVHNGDLADFLTLIADGQVDGMLAPAFADPLLNLMAHTAGHVTREDLAGYRVIQRQPLAVDRGSSRVLLNPPPAFGGAIVADCLGSLDSIDGSPQSWASVVATLRSATERNRRQSVDRAELRVSKGTTHVSVVDFEGQVACVTTSNGAGSGVVVPGTGIHLNNMMGEEDLNPDGFHVHPPGLRMSSMMAPTIIETTDGDVTGLGTGGSERIRSALLATVLRIADLGMAADAAVGAARIHPEPNMVQLESGWDSATLAGLCDAGAVNVWPEPNLFFGGVHAVTRAADGSVMAVGDARRGGVALAVAP